MDMDHDDSMEMELPDELYPTQNLRRMTIIQEQADPKHGRAGMGIVIANPEDRNKGVGAEAIKLMCDYAFSTLNLHQLYANILEENKTSIHLFEKMGFEKVGVKKEWIRTSTGFKNEIMFQKINTNVS